MDGAPVSWAIEPMSAEKIATTRASAPSRRTAEASSSGDSVEAPRPAGPGCPKRWARGRAGELTRPPQLAGAGGGRDTRAAGGSDSEGVAWASSASHFTSFRSSTKIA